MNDRSGCLVACRGCEGGGVLVVDDDEDCRELLGSLLGDGGYRFTLQPDASSALSYLRAGRRPCVILLDLQMPGMDGEEFLSELQRDASMACVPAVVMSGSGRHRGLPAAAYLDKPFSREQLLATVRRCCALAARTEAPR